MSRRLFNPVDDRTREALSDKFRHVAGRPLSNPFMRLPLRADMPDVVSYESASAVITAELAKLGEDISTVDQIWIAYPQKDRRLFPGYHGDGGRAAAKDIHDQLFRDANKTGAFPFKITHAIGEAISLNRSEYHDALHSLVRRQQYLVNEQDSSNPFLKSEPGKPPFFVIADHCVETGATIANLASYIMHNGGYVLALVVNWDICGRSLLPHDSLFRFAGMLDRAAQESLKASQTFSQAPYKAYLLELARVLAEGPDTPKDMGTVIDTVEASLNRYGRSLTTLTYGEAKYLIRDIQDGVLSYTDLVSLPDPAEVTLITQQPKSPKSSPAPTGMSA